MRTQTAEINTLEDRRGSILALDKNSSNLELIRKFLGREGYRVIGVSSIEKFKEKILNEPAIKLAVIDVSGFDRRVWNCCEKLKMLDIPFLVISPKQSAMIKQQGINYGAEEIMVKPLSVKYFLSTISYLVNN